MDNLSNWSNYKLKEMRMLKISKNICICLLALTANSCTSPSLNPLPTKSATCPDKPVESLSPSDVKNVTLNATAVKESGSISAGKMKGFTFKAKKGQQIEYKTADNLCIWVFSQDNKLITGKTLSSDGNYTLQITVPQGTTTFDLEISLDANQSPKPVAVATPIASPTPVPTQTVVPTNVPVATTPPPTQTVAPSPTNTRDQQIDEIAETVSGTWEGTYVCGQGLTKLRLEIDAKSSNDIDAVFNFSAHSSNPSVPSGSFRMKGSYSAFNSPNIPALLELKGTSWIERPSGYVTVDLRGNVFVSESRISGDVTTPGCSKFELVSQNSSKGMKK